jgi:phosphoribosylamine---glycine ligase
MGMKVLVLGSGGREHSLAKKIGESPLVEQVLVAPGNAGISDANRRALSLWARREELFPAVLEVVQRERIDLVVVGPERPLVDGIADHLRRHVAVFGPSKAASQLEGSKSFCKSICRACGIPQAAGFFDIKNMARAERAVKELGGACVVKADGIARGQGVKVAESADEALTFAQELLAGKLGEAGRTLVIEERLTGRECSAMALVDKEHVLMLEPARDYKRAFDGDQGPNTGGMGAYSPLPDVNRKVMRVIKTSIIEPLAKAMAAHQHLSYQGVLYAGVMLTPTGPKLLEVNCRFGDPECQVLLPRFEGDLVPYLLACAEGRLSKLRPPKWSTQAAVGVVIAHNDYPTAEHCLEQWIYGIGDAEATGARVYHSGTAYNNGAGHLVSSGGRVLTVVGRGVSVGAAREAAYRACKRIELNNFRYRKDIGKGFA